MLLAEELALVALKPDSGRVQLGTGGNLNACLAGLLVAELLLDGSVGPGDRDDRLAVVPDRPTPDSPALAAALEVVAERGPKMKGVLSHMSRGLEVVAPERSIRTHARNRIDHALDASNLEPVGTIVRRIIQEAAEVAGATAAIGGAAAAGS